MKSIRALVTVLLTIILFVCVSPFIVAAACGETERSVFQDDGTGRIVERCYPNTGGSNITSPIYEVPNNNMPNNWAPPTVPAYGFNPDAATVTPYPTEIYSVKEDQQPEHPSELANNIGMGVFGVCGLGGGLLLCVVLLSMRKTPKHLGFK